MVFIVCFGCEDDPIEEPVVEEIWKVVENMPTLMICQSVSNDRFSCTQEELESYITENIQYSNEAIESMVSGQIIYQFVVDKMGNLESFKIVNDVGFDCGDSLVEALDKMPAWIPGMQRDRNVKVLMTFMYDVAL